MKTSSLKLLAAAAFLGVPGLHAQPGPGGAQRQGRPPGPPPPPLVLIALDLDADGIISAAEISKASESLLTLDKNKNGKLEKDEIMPKPPKRERGQSPGGGPQGGNRDEQRNGPRNGQRHDGPPPFPLIVVLDTDKDGELSAQEIAAAPAQLKTLDKNGDGQLGPGEYAPRPPKDDQDAPDQNGGGGPQGNPPE